MPFRDDREARDERSRALERELATARHELELSRRRERALARRFLRRPVLLEQHYPVCSDRAFDRMVSSLRDRSEAAGGSVRQTPSKIEFRRGELEVSIERHEHGALQLTLRDTEPALSRLFTLYGLSAALLTALALLNPNAGALPAYAIAMPVAMTSLVFVVPLATMGSERASGYPYRRALWEELNAIATVDQRVTTASAAVGVRVGPAPEDTAMDEATTDDAATDAQQSASPPRPAAATRD